MAFVLIEPRQTRKRRGRPNCAIELVFDVEPGDMICA